MDKRSISGYNLIAEWYDDLAGLVFGQPLFDAQIYFFTQIPDDSSVLILGGGSGWILPFLFKNKANIQVCYIDASEKMLDLAKQRSYPVNQVQFICGTEESIPENSQFDAVILNFYLDGFSYDELPSRLELINSTVREQGLWLITDFMHTSRLNHRFILWITHVFFRMLISHPNKRLVEWWKVMDQTGFKIKTEGSWNKGLIKSIIYSKE